MRNRLAWFGEQAGWSIGIVGCLLLMLVLLPLAPLFEMHDEIRRLHEEGAKEARSSPARRAGALIGVFPT